MDPDEGSVKNILYGELLIAIADYDQHRNDHGLRTSVPR